MFNRLTVALSVLVCVSLPWFPAYCSLLGFGLGFSDPICFLALIASLRVLLFFSLDFFKHLSFYEFYLSVHFIALVALGEEVWVCVKSP